MGRKPKVFEPAYAASPTRYKEMVYRRVGRSGLTLSSISLGLWHNFGDDTPHDVKKAICRTAFDLGVTHFDLANNYGPPPGSAEDAFGKILRNDFRPYRDELIISSKAGYDMWPGPYGEWGSRKHVIASCDASLRRLGIDYVDVFYSHRFDPVTPLSETASALDQIVRSGKALYVGISSYNAARTKEMVRLLKALATPVVMHQPSYNILNRWIERDSLLAVLEQEGLGAIAFTPLAQGLLTSKYLDGIPTESRASLGKSLDPALLTDDVRTKLQGLNDIAAGRGQTLAQMALSWVLRHEGISSALIGASRPEQVRDCVAAVSKTTFDANELAAIDALAFESGINLWARSSEDV